MTLNLTKDQKIQLGRHIRGLREEHGLTQAKLAERAGLDATYVAKIEDGERAPSLDSTMKLATALNVSAAYIVAALDMDDEATERNGQLRDEIAAMIGGCSSKQLRFVRDFLLQLKGYDADE